MRVGILGGGQLARMLALAGHPLGLHVTVLDPKGHPCAASVADHIQAEFTDSAALDRLAAASDVVTYEFEQVPEAAVAALAGQVPVKPGVRALGTGRDRWHEKTLFHELGIPTARFAAVDAADDLPAAIAEVGLPAVLKTRTLGYDGKGQEVLAKADDAGGAWQRLGERPLILEEKVAFDREVSVVAARDGDGDCRFYTLAANAHREGILRQSTPQPADPVQPAAEANARALMAHLDYVGVVALEMFQVGDHLLANEMAPRVHNSGHWTIEGADTSQFANHMRAICGFPLGSVASIGSSTMINLIGEPPDHRTVLATPGAHLHLYDKAPQAGRKVGHLTLRASEPESFEERLAGLRATLDEAGI